MKKNLWQKSFRFVILFFLCFIGCTTYNAATGRREFIIIPTDSEVSMGQDIHQKLLQQYELSSDTKQKTRLNRIGQKIAQVSDRQDYAYHFHLIEKDEMNAFTTPGGNIYVFSGLLNKLKTDDEIASVLAHETGHCAAKHTIKKFQAAVGYSVVENVVLGSLGMEDQVRKIVSLGSDALNNLIFSAYGRQDEFEADKLGLKYMYLAGYDLNGMIKTFEVLKSNSKGLEVPLILRTHPYLDDRIKVVQKEIERIQAEDRSGGAEFLK